MTTTTTEASTTPALTVVLVAPRQFAALRRTLKYLRAQTIANQLELIVLGTTDAQLAAHVPEEIAGFHTVRFVAVGNISNVDAAYPRALPHTTASHVAFIEDHAYPMPEWAEAVVRAARSGFDVIGTALMNANPDSMLSWANMCIAYTNLLSPAFTGERGSVGLHNSTFRRDALLEYGEQLAGRMGRDGGLLQDMKAKGKRFYLPASARIAHANPSRMRSTCRLRFNAGRSYGAQRAAMEGWSGSKRVLYTMGGFMIPLVRFVRLYRDLQRIYKYYHLLPRALPALLLALGLDALGQMAGYALGYGASRDILAGFEMDRLQHLTSADRRLLQST